MSREQVIAENLRCMELLHTINDSIKNPYTYMLCGLLYDDGNCDNCLVQNECTHPEANEATAKALIESGEIKL